MPDSTLIPYLNDDGFNPIRLPHAGFEPLRLMGGGTKTSLNYLGNLAELLVPGAALPPVDRDDQSPSYGNRFSNSLDASAGVSFLETILGLVGAGKVGGSAAYARAKTFQYAYFDVRRDSVTPISLLGLTREMFKPNILAGLSSLQYIYLVTDTLKSNQFGVVAYDDRNVKLEPTADALGELVKLNASLSVGSGKNGIVTYSGPAYLRFAFKAMAVTFSPDKDPEWKFDRSLIQEKGIVAGDGLQAAFEVIEPGAMLDIPE